MIIVGRADVFIVDTKAWHNVAAQKGRISRGQEDVTG